MAKSKHSAAPKGDGSSRGQTYLICLLLAAVTLAIYWQTRSFELVNYDDEVCIRRNAVVNAGLGPAGIRMAFSTAVQGNWIPLVWLSYMMDNDSGGQVYGLAPAGVYHMTNLLLHLANAILLFLLLTLVTRSHWKSAFVAMLFAVHPLHVESVAWATERKDVLSTFFWLLAMLAYLRYTARPCATRYMLVVTAFVLGLMSKSMLVTLPIVLVLFDYWPLRRGVKGAELRPGPEATFPALRLLREKLPLLAIAGAACVVTLWAQRTGGAVTGIDTLPLGVRLANAAVAYIAYIGKTFWPHDLIMLYAHPRNTLPVWQVVASGALLVATTAAAVLAARKRPYITFGWLWYVITLVPVIGLVQVGKQAMADRYTYIPLIGLFVIIAWGVPDLLGPFLRKKAPGRTNPATVPLAVVSIVVVATLAAIAYRQTGYWKDSISLCKHAIEVNDALPLAHLNLGTALAGQGDLPGAIEQYRIVVRLTPNDRDVHYNLANVLAKAGNDGEAIAEYRRALSAFPEDAQAHNNFGVLLARNGYLGEAITQFEQALSIDPSYIDAQHNLDRAKQLLHSRR